MISSMNIIPYGRHFLDKTDIESVIRVLKSDRITQGSMVQKFESAIAERCGCKYAVVVSSGTAALHLACLAAGLKKGDEAITSPITFLATSNAIIYTGAKPVFADIDYETANISPQEILRHINGRTKAILPVHFAGLPADMEKISQIARKRRLIVIEDACHALGAEYKGKKIGSCWYSDMTVFSFHPVKAITTGEGGAVTTNNRRLYQKLLALRSHGVYKDRKALKKGPWYYEMRHLGFNYRITDFQCALGISQLKKLDRFLNRRRQIAAIYDKELAMARDFFKLPPLEYPDRKHAWHLYLLRLKRHKGTLSRKNLFRLLFSKGVGVQVHYIPVYRQPFYKAHGFSANACPLAEKYYSEVLSLPIFPDLGGSEIKYVIGILKEWVESKI